VKKEIIKRGDVAVGGEVRVGFDRDMTKQIISIPTPFYHTLFSFAAVQFAFNGLPPGRRREYATRIGSAKCDEMYARCFSEYLREFFLMEGQVDLSKK
jgi:hypothetical protein